MMGREHLRELLALAMEVFWYFAVASALAAGLVDGAGPSFWALLAAAAGGFYLSRLLSAYGGWGLSSEVVQAVGLASTVLGLYAILRLEYLGDLRLWNLSWLSQFTAHPDSARGPVVLGSLLTVALWLRWAWQGRTSLAFAGVLLSFSVGFLAVVLALLTTAGGLESDAEEAVVPFFALGLLSLAFYHQASSGTAPSTALARPWALALLATVAVLLALATPAWLVGGVNVDPVLEPVGRGLLWVVDLLFRFLFYLLTPVLRGVWWVATQLAERFQENALMRREPAEEMQQAGQEEGKGGGLPLPLLMLGRVLAGFLLAALIGLAAWALFRRLLRWRGERDESRESVWQEGSLARDLGDLLGRLLSIRRGPRAPPAPDLPPDLMAVRRLYLDVLRRARERGLERPPPVTPLEFAPPLDEHFRSPLPGEVSRAFARARYGLKALPPGELRRLRRQWEEADK